MIVIVLPGAEDDADLTKRSQALAAIEGVERVILARSQKPSTWRDEINRLESRQAKNRMKTPGVYDGANIALLSGVKVTIATLERMLDTELEGVKELKAIVHGAALPTDDKSQERFDAFMSDKKAEAEKTAEKVKSAFSSFKFTETVRGIEESFENAIREGKARICKTLLAQAKTRADSVLGEQVADVVAQKKLAVKTAEERGVVMAEDSPAMQAWVMTHNAAHSARSHVRKSFEAIESECKKGNVDKARVALFKFRNACDFCLRKYADLESALGRLRMELLLG